MAQQRKRCDQRCRAYAARRESHSVSTKNEWVSAASAIAAIARLAAGGTNGTSAIVSAATCTTHTVCRRRLRGNGACSHRHQAPAATTTETDNSLLAAVKLLQEMKAANDEILAKQAATLTQLDELQKAADQIRIYTKRS